MNILNNLCVKCWEGALWW